MMPIKLAGLALLLLAAAGRAQPPEGDAHGPRHGGGRGGARDATFISPMGEPFRDAGGREANARAWFARADADHDGRLTRAELRGDADRFFTSLDVNGDGEIDPDEIDRYEREVAPEVRVGGGGFGGGRPGGGGGGMRHGGGGHGGGGHGGGGAMGAGRGTGPVSGDGARPSSGGAAAPVGEPLRQGAGAYGYIDLPEPVISADADFNRGVSRAEFAAAADRRFLLLDTNGKGALTFDTLPPLPERSLFR